MRNVRCWMSAMPRIVVDAEILDAVIECVDGEVAPNGILFLISVYIVPRIWPWSLVQFHFPRLCHGCCGRLPLLQFQGRSERARVESGGQSVDSS